MRSSGIDWVHVYCVDNVLVKPADVAFLGLCVKHSVDVASKAVEKRDANESAGVFAIRDKSLQVVEYSELDAKLAASVEANGRLLFSLANIANHVMSVAFLEQAASSSLPHHLAKKKIKNASGVAIEGYKLEAFIFDAFPLASKHILYAVDRENEFSPLKNGPGSTEDNAETCLAALKKCRQ